MDHSYFRDKVSAFFDKGLPAEEMFMMAEHISECPECQKLLAEYERLDKLTADSRDLADDDYWERSARKIEQRLGFSELETPVTSITPQRRRSALGWKLIGAAASVAVLTIIGIHQTEILGPSQDHSNGVQAPALSKPGNQTFDYDAVPAQDLYDKRDVEPERTAEQAGGPSETIESADESAAEPVPVRDELKGGEAEPESDMEKVEEYAAMKSEIMSPKPIIDSAEPPVSVEGATDLKGAGETVVDVALSSDTAKNVAISVKAETPQVQHDKAADAGAQLDKMTNSFGDHRRESVMQAPSSPLRLRESDEVEPDEAPPPDSLDLDYWQARRDSLAAIMSTDANAHRSAMAKKDVQQLAQSASDEAREQQETDLAAYYKAVYMVARLTDDRREYYRSVDSLRAYVERFEAPLRELVQGYLDKLDE